MVDRISPTLAVVKAQLEMMGGVMQDSLNVVRVGSGATGQRLV